MSNISLIICSEILYCHLSQLSSLFADLIKLFAAFLPFFCILFALTEEKSMIRQICTGYLWKEDMPCIPNSVNCHFKFNKKIMLTLIIKCFVQNILLQFKYFHTFPIIQLINLGTWRVLNCILGSCSETGPKNKHHRTLFSKLLEILILWNISIEYIVQEVEYIIQEGVPINMGIQCRIRYRLCYELAL